MGSWYPLLFVFQRCCQFSKSPVLLFRSALILASTPKDIHLSIHRKNSLRSTGTAGIFPPWRPFHSTLVKCPDLITSSLPRQPRSAQFNFKQMTLRQLWHEATPCLSNMSIAATLPTCCNSPNSLQTLAPVLSEDCSRRFRFHDCQEEAKNHIQWSYESNSLIPRMGSTLSRVWESTSHHRKTLRKHQHLMTL